ncbi:hypothetical protein KEM52_003384, partial [Ascosphaera acerosa]
MLMQRFHRQSSANAAVTQQDAPLQAAESLNPHPPGIVLHDVGESSRSATALRESTVDDAQDRAGRPRTDLHEPDPISHHGALRMLDSYLQPSPSVRRRKSSAIELQE